MPDNRPASSPGILDRARGTPLGLAVGDALDTALECKPPGSFTPLVDMVGGEPSGSNRGSGN